MKAAGALGIVGLVFVVVWFMVKAMIGLCVGMYRLVRWFVVVLVPRHRSAT